MTKSTRIKELKSMAGVVISFFVLGFFLSWARAYVDMDHRHARHDRVLAQAQAEELVLLTRGNQ